MPRQRGYSLIELVIAVGIIALVAATGAGLTLASRSLAVAAAASEFDQLLDSARTMARAVGGGRLSFAPDGDGTIARFAAHAADGTLVPTTLPPLYTHAHIAEQEVLGDPEFALVLHANGRLGGIPNARSAEVACPASGAYHIRITAGGGSADRFLPCRTTLATSGTLAFTGWPAATTAPSPAADCGSPCSPPPLPSAPSPAPSSAPSATPTPATTPTPLATATATSTPSAAATPTVLATPTPTPLPIPTATPVATCDLVQNGTCYRRIQGPTLESFQKEVTPGYTCDSTGMTCAWANTVGRVVITAQGSYSIQPPIAPTEAAHQLLFVVDGVAVMASQCAPFGFIRDLVPSPPIEITWFAAFTGPSGGNYSNIGLTPGYGQPATYAYRNQIVYSTSPTSGRIAQSDSDATQYSRTIDQFAFAVGNPLYSNVVSTTYSDTGIGSGDYVTYVPDFTDCASGLPDDRRSDDQLYGITTAVIVVEAYQAVQ